MEQTVKKESIQSRIRNSEAFHKVQDVVSRVSGKKWVRYVCFLYVVCFAMFIYTLIRNQCTIPVSGDFTLQEIPFYFNGYDDWWHAITTGEFVMWDDSAFLGVNNIGANSFYYLFNPFFLVLLIFPRSFMPQAQALMMITKMVLAGVTMKLLLEKFKVREETTWLFGTAYAFCGWNLYYLWFNHFLEISVLMPLVLLGIEKILRDQKPMFLLLTLFVSGLTNYFFLICFCFCGVLYAMFRYFQNMNHYNAVMRENRQTHERILDIRIQVILQGIFAFAAGLMLASVVLIPCFYVAITTPRAAQATYLEDLKVLWEEFSVAFKSGEGAKESFWAMWDFLFKWPETNGKKYVLYPLIAFLTPNVTCFDSVIFNHSYYDNTYASMFLFTPILLFFLPSVIQAMRRHAVATTLGLLGIGFLLFTPFAYYCFSGFTSVAYARWYIFVAAIAVVFIAVQYDQRKQMSIAWLDISFAAIIFMYGYLIYQGGILVDDPTVTNLKEMDEAVYYLYGEILYLLFQYLYLRKHFRKPDLTGDLRYFVAFEAIVMCNITLVGQGTSAYANLYQGIDNITEEVALAQELLQEDDSYYRVFSTTCDRNGNNLAMRLGTPGVGTFHSIYDFELQDFINWSTISYNGSWSMGVHEKRIHLDEFLGIKYYILKNGDTNVPLGFSEYMTTDDHVVYINDNFIELGFAYDTVYPSSLMSTYSTGVLMNEDIYLSGAVLSSEDIEELFGEGNEDIAVRTNTSALQNDFKTVDPGSANIQVYRAIWENDVNTGFEDPVSYSSSATTALTWNSYLDIDTKGLSIASEASPENRCYVAVQARMGENLEITLYGETDDGTEYVLTKDRHMTHWYADKQYDRKNQRGFYVDDEVTRIEIRVYETMTSQQSLMKPLITYEYEDVYNQKIAKLKENPLLNIEKNANDFSFDTEFDAQKFVVLQIPYDEGWSLCAYDAQGNEVGAPKIYKATGGFLSFLAEAGNYHYQMKYETPRLKAGIQVMAGGMVVTGTYYIAAFYFGLRKKKFAREWGLV